MIEENDSNFSVVPQICEEKMKILTDRLNYREYLTKRDETRIIVNR